MLKIFAEIIFYNYEKKILKRVFALLVVEKPLISSKMRFFEVDYHFYGKISIFEKKNLTTKRGIEFSTKC
jgi:hypothetical protein